MAQNDSRPESELLGLEEFEVLDILERQGELELSIQTRAVSTGCHDCGTAAVLHDRRTVRVRDLPIAGRPTVLCWRKRMWRCPDPDCFRRTWSEGSQAIAARALLTERARREICRRVGQDGAAVAQVARAFGVGWATAMRAVRDHGEPLVDDPQRLAGVVALGLDETAFLKATPHSPTRYVTGMVDLDRGRLLDVVPQRTTLAVSRWLDARPDAFVGDISVVALDPWRGYANALVTRLGHATVVVDRFHGVKLANRAVDDVRRRVQQASLGHRGRRSDPLYRVRKLLLVAVERLDRDAKARLDARLAAGDPSGEVGAAWQGKELLRRLWRAEDLEAARQALEAFYRWCAGVEIPELDRLARTVRVWEAEILAFHTTAGRSNGRTEAVNLLIKKVKRVGHGFRNFRNYRLRLLLHCGVSWQTHEPARLRGRLPRLTA